MIIRIDSWESKGLRCPDSKVVLYRDNHYKKINLLQMPNGTGKSTIIELISACLTGEAERTWSAEKLKQFGNPLDDTDNGVFELCINISDNEDKNQYKVTFRLNLDFATGTASYMTNSNPTVGLEIGWKPPRELKKFLHDRCVEVFVFKGDKADNLIETGRNEAELSIKAFCGLSHIEEIAENVIDREFAKEIGSGPQTSQTLDKRRRVLAKWIGWLEDLEEKREKAQNGYDKAEAEHREIRGRVEDIIEGQQANKEILEELSARKAACETELSKANHRTFDAFRNPFFLSNKISQRMTLLKENLDALKLPGTSGEFFKELADLENCICDRPIAVEHKDAILENSKSYLSDEHVSVLNGIKRDTEKYDEQARLIADENPLSFLAATSTAFNDALDDLEAHEAKIRSEATESQRELLDRFENISNEMQKFQIALDAYDNKSGDPRTFSSGLPEQCPRIPVVKKVIELREKEISDLTGTAAQYDAKEKLKRVLSNAMKQSLIAIKRDLKQRSNLKLADILPKGEPLEILEISENLKLGFQGRTQGSASGGQKVAVAYSFATSILERSGIQFPLIVDHPVTALQESARRGLGQRLADVSHQFIGFIIDTERPGFVDSLEETKADINYVTIFKKIDANHSYMEKLPNDTSFVFESANGVVCTDKIFFNNFIDSNPEGAPDHV